MYVDLVILANLAVRPQHGYEIKKSVERVLGPEVNLNNGMLYPALRRFEEMGAVEREVERHEGKPDRHIYHLTSLGHEVLHDLATEFPPEVARNETEFLVRVSFFDLLEPHERLAILDARTADRRRSLERHDEIMEMVRAMADAEHVPMPQFPLEVLAHDKEKTVLELAWLERLRREVTQEVPRQHDEGDSR
jgi:DNA-binding PadR family transcriptional regulator